MIDDAIKEGDSVLWNHNYWRVSSVNYKKDGSVYSLSLIRHGVSTCVELHDVTLIK